MALTYILKLSHFVIPAVISSLLVSCIASQHVGVTTIQQPMFSEENESVWFQYYQDQFDTKEGNVVLPSEGYPQAAVQAYQRARTAWENKVQEAQRKTIALYVIAGIACFGIGYAIYTAIFPIEGNIVYH